jgi:hypothetical protein
VQTQLDREAVTPDRRLSERLFHRDLPGGGYVAIEVGGASTERMVRLVVERRAERGRRAGHQAPVIHEEPWKAERGVGELYRVACDNVAIARGLLELTRGD